MLAKIVVALLLSASVAKAADDAKTVADLDTRYQAAVKVNDADTMASILDDRFVLVVGSGKAYTRQELLDSAREKTAIYEKQDEEAGSQTVRLFGDTAVVTAKLWLKGTSGGKPFERKLWFSDTYVRTPAGWRYAFGQASLPIPAESAPPAHP